MGFGDMVEKLFELIGIIFNGIVTVLGWIFSFLIDVIKWLGIYYQEVGIGIFICIVLSGIVSLYNKIAERQREEKERQREEEERQREEEEERQREEREEEEERQREEEERQREEEERQRKELMRLKLETCPDCGKVEGGPDGADIVEEWDTVVTVEKNDRDIDIKWIKVREKEYYKCGNCACRYEVNEKVRLLTDNEMKRICPSCNQKQGYFDSTDIVNQYETTKEVEEKTAGGMYKTRRVKCTKVVEKDFYKCNSCGHRYEVDENTRELK